MLPKHFCWTRFGTEAGEEITSILKRKEIERLATGGLFLWGIGNSVGPAMRDLVRLELQPRVVFSPMRSKPKVIDVAPCGVLQWTLAQDLDGNEWRLPDGIKVTSRQGIAGGRKKRTHYALVCRSPSPLVVEDEQSLCYDAMVNLQSKSKLGASQVTAVVEHFKSDAEKGTPYSVAFTADLVFPYFVKLENPVDTFVKHTEPQVRQTSSQQLSLITS